MPKRVNYFEKAQIAPEDERCILIPFDAAYLPMVLSRIETAKGRSWFVDQENAERGYERLTALQWGMLMDCGQALINNIIALRGIDPTAPRDPDTGTPIAPPTGSTLLDIYTTLQGASGTPGSLLERIATATEATQAATVEGLGTDLEDGALLLQLLAML